MSLQRKAEISTLLLWDTWDLETIPCRSIDRLSSGFENQTITKHPLASGRLSVSFGKVTFYMQNQLRQSDYDKWGKEWIGAPFEVSIFCELYQLYINSDINTYWLRYFINFFLSFGLLLFYRYYYSLNLLCAHSACQFSMLNIRKTR